MTTDLATHRHHHSVTGPVLTFGFGATVVLWSAWFMTHLPWIALAEATRIVILLAVWIATMVWCGLVIGRSSGWKVGMGAGLTTSVLGLLLLGTKLAPQSGSVDLNRPSSALVVLGFLGLGLAIGLVGGGLGGVFSATKAETTGHPDWLARFGLVAIAAAVPLIVVGGLVTSTNSGMAVPDWPGTYGHNMFLFPLAGAVPELDKPYEKVFFEHSHRLFGTLLGVTTLTLLIWAWIVESRKWVKIWVASVFAVVCIQGVLGGVRVLRDSAGVGVIHGVLAQVTLAGLVAIAVFFWATPQRLALTVPYPNPRRVRAMATAALHTTLLQLVLGALYRHLRVPHALWTHVGFSFVVLVAAMLGGFVASAVPRESGSLARALRTCGFLMVGVVVLQFLLGWATLGAGGQAREAASVAAALLRTSHQANGALLLGLTTATAVLAKLLYRQIAANAAPSMEPAATTA